MSMILGIDENNKICSLRDAKCIGTISELQAYFNKEELLQLRKLEGAITGQLLDEIDRIDEKDRIDE